MANVIEFTIKGIDAGSGVVGKFSSSLGGLIKSTAAVTAVAAGAIAGTYAFVKSMTEGADKAAKFARMIGSSVEELTAYQHAADLSGLSQEQFNKSLQVMTRNIAEAADGTGVAVVEFAKLGVNAQQLSSMPLDGKMGLLADKLSGVGDAGERTRIAMKLFGEEGVKMINLLESGSDGMRKLTDDAKFLGLTISAQAGANAEAFGDSLTRVGGAMKGIGMGISNELAPMLTGLANQFANALAGARESIVSFVRESVQNLFALGIAVGQIVTTIKDSFGKLFTAEGFSNFVQMAKDTFLWFADFALGIFPFISNAMYQYFKVAFESVVAVGKWAWENIKAVFTGDTGPSLGELLFKSIPKATADARAAMEAEISGLLDFTVAKSAEAGEAVASAFGVNWAMAQEQAASMIEALSEYGTVAEEIDALSMERHQTFMDYLREANEEFMADRINTTQLMADQIHGAIQTSIQGIGDATAAAMIEGANLATLLQGVAKQALASVISMLVQMGVQRMVLAAMNKSATASEATTAMSTGLAETFVNAYKSTAAIPVIGPVIAPGVAAAAVAGATSGATAAAAAGAGLGASIAGVAHGGLDYVPKEATYLLDKGERVLSPGQNRDLENFMEGGGGAGQTVVVQNLNVHVLENATNADAFLRMDKVELRERVAMPILEQLGALARRGIKAEGY